MQSQYPEEAACCLVSTHRSTPLQTALRHRIDRRSLFFWGIVECTEKRTPGIRARQPHRGLSRTKRRNAVDPKVMLDEFTAVYERGEQGWIVASCPEILGAVGQARHGRSPREPEGRAPSGERNLPSV